MQAVAKIGRLYGSDGELAVNLNPSFPSDFSRDTPLFVLVDGLTVPLYCDSFMRRGVSGANVRFADIDTERRALELVGCELYMQIDESAEIPLEMDSLIGFRVLINGVEGELTAYYESDMNPLFEIFIDGREVLIPAVEEFIQGVDIEGRLIEICPPEGLMEL